MVWTEYGLFRYEPGANSCVRLLHPPAEAERKFDSATGVMRWNRQRYRLVGDPAVVPHTSVEAALADDDRGDRPGVALCIDTERRFVEVVEGGEVTLAVADFPRAGDAWHFAGFVSWCAFVLAGPSGLQRYHCIDPPAPPAPPPPQPVGRWEAAGLAADHAALLAGVVAAPDDDLPRLVYADWLDENGDPARAEFIRLQCWIAERERTAPVPDADPDRRREGELLNDHERDWWDERPAVRGVERTWDAGWWRGFPGLQVKSAVTLARSAARLLAAGPVESVNIWDRNRRGSDGGLAALLDAPVVERVRVLNLSSYGYNHEQMAALGKLFASPRLGRLRGLVMRHCSADAIPLLAGAGHLTGLEWVHLMALTDEAVTALTVSRHLPSVRWVRVGRQSECGPAARRALRKRFAHCVFEK